jgi:hypothetical protein
MDMKRSSQTGCAYITSNDDPIGVLKDIEVNVTEGFVPLRGMDSNFTQAIATITTGIYVSIKWGYFTVDPRPDFQDTFQDTNEVFQFDVDLYGAGDSHDVICTVSRCRIKSSDLGRSANEAGELILRNILCDGGNVIDR